MDPWSLTRAAMIEPWRLWTGHLVHYSAAHALSNAFALAVPLILLPEAERPAAIRALLIGAPLLSLTLLPLLSGGDAYRGASGLACILWALAGLRLCRPGEAVPVGLLLLTGLTLKLAAEAMALPSGLVPAGGWRALPAAHLRGAMVGLVLGLLPGDRARRA